MTHIAKSYVYRNLDENEYGEPLPGYVGRSPRGNFEKVAHPGAVLSDELVAELKLEDLEDHTDYDGILKAAHKLGRPVTARNDEGAVQMKVKGKWATGDEEAWNSAEEENE